MTVSRIHLTQLTGPSPKLETKYDLLLLFLKKVKKYENYTVIRKSTDPPFCANQHHRASGGPCAHSVNLGKKYEIGRGMIILIYHHNT